MSTKQEEKGTFETRSDQLAHDLGISLRELAPKIGMSVSSLFAYRSESRPISRKAWRKLEVAESQLRHTPGLVQEDATTYSQPRNQSRLGGSDGVVAPRREPAPDAPTRADCEARLARALDLAEELPGGLGVAYGHATSMLADIITRKRDHELTEGE